MAPRSTGNYHHGDLRRALLEAAIQAIDEDGPRQFSLRRLAQGLNVSHAAAYRHFRDVDDLVAAVAEEGMRQMAEALQKVAAETDDIREAMLGCAVAYVRFGLDHPGLYRAMISETTQREPAPKAAADRVFAVPVELMQRAQAEGYVRAGDNVEQARAAWAMVHGLLDLNLRGQLGNASDDEILDQTRRLVGAFLVGLFEAPAR